MSTTTGGRPAVGYTLQIRTGPESPLHGKSVPTIATETHLPAASVARWMTGRTPASTTFFAHLAVHYGVPLDSVAYVVRKEDGSAAGVVPPIAPVGEVKVFKGEKEAPLKEAKGEKQNPVPQVDSPWKRGKVDPEPHGEDLEPHVWLCWEWRRLSRSDKPMTQKRADKAGEARAAAEVALGVLKPKGEAMRALDVTERLLAGKRVKPLT